MYFFRDPRGPPDCKDRFESCSDEEAAFEDSVEEPNVDSLFIEKRDFKNIWQPGR